MQASEQSASEPTRSEATEIIQSSLARFVRSLGRMFEGSTGALRVFEQLARFDRSLGWAIDIIFLASSLTHLGAILLTRYARHVDVVPRLPLDTVGGDFVDGAFVVGSTRVGVYDRRNHDDFVLVNSFPKQSV